MQDLISLNELLKGMSQLVGLERAQELVNDAVAAQGLSLESSYEREKMRRICKELMKAGGLISVVVSAVAMRLLMAPPGRNGGSSIP